MPLGERDRDVALRLIPDQPDGDVSVTIDVEWAHPAVLADVVGLLDDHGVRATFFCTHAGIEVPGHERALHPNFRRSGNSLSGAIGADPLDDRAFYRSIVAATQELCAEAVGVRSHSLFTDSDLLPIYRDAGLQYDSSYMLPLAAGLAPAWKGSGILEIPLYYMDHWDLREQASGFTLDGLRLDDHGLKVVAFHPNLIFMNASSLAGLSEMKEHYHDPEWLLARRNQGRGVRTLFLDLLGRLARSDTRPPLLREVNAKWRGEHELLAHGKEAEPVQAGS